MLDNLAGPAGLAIYALDDESSELERDVKATVGRDLIKRLTTP